MDDKKCIRTSTYEGFSNLVSEVSKIGFGKAVIKHICETARIENFGAYYFPDLSHPKPVLSVWSGKISDYWFRRNAAEILANRDLQTKIVELIRASPQDGVQIERWSPSEGDPRHPIFQKANILERISVSSRVGRAGYQSFYLRGVSNGWLTDEELDQLFQILPAVHALTCLRHHVVGSESFQFQAGTSASSLRERNVMGFSKLSVREVEICDCLVEGKTVVGTALELGISESTVRTLRQRAYRKLDVSSAVELMSLIVNDAQVS